MGFSSHHHTTPHHCSHAWLLKVALKKDPLCICARLAQTKLRGMLHAQGHMTSHSNTHTYFVTHAYRHTFCSTWRTHRHTLFLQTEPWQGATGCMLFCHNHWLASLTLLTALLKLTHIHAQEPNPFQSNPE